MYPEGWPKCDCGRPVLDGHLTCGDAACGTQVNHPLAESPAPGTPAQAEARLRTKPTFRVNTGPARIFRGECVLCGSQWHRTSQCPENDL